jgi:hypothetical protein
MHLTSAIAVALGSSWASGINLYAAVAMLGCLHRFGGVELPGDLAICSNWLVILVAVVMYCVEFVADKIPYFDTCWDVIHTFIRVPAGAALAAASFADFDPATKAVLFLLGGGIALTAHGSKAATRVLINTSPEPFTNFAASVGEDAAAFSMVWLVVFFPILGLLVLIALFAATAYLLPKIIRLLVIGFQRLRTFLTGRPVEAIVLESPPNKSP